MTKLLERLAADVAERKGWSLWRARRLQALVVLISYTGLRKAEALYCQVDDCDLDNGVVHVVSRSSHRLKTGSSEAFVTIPPAAVKVLREWLLHRMDAPLDSSALRTPICSRTFDPVRPGRKAVEVKSHSIAFRPWRNAAGVSATFQMLRRTVATNMEAHGAAASQIQRQLRHSNVATTQGFYMERDRQNMANVMDGFGYN